MRKAKKIRDEPSDNDQGKRRLTLTRLLIWAEQEAADLGRPEAAKHINLAIGELFDTQKK